MRLSGHRVYGDAPQESYFLVVARAHLHAFHQCFQVGRVTLSAHFHANLVGVGQIFVAVNRVAHLPQVVMQQLFFLMNDGVARDRQRGGRQNHQDRAGNDQFEQTHALLGMGMSVIPMNSAHKTTFYRFTAALATWPRQLPAEWASAANPWHSLAQSTDSMLPARWLSPRCP